MAKFKILTVPNPLLRQKSVMVDPKNQAIKRLARELMTFLKNGPEGKSLGVGLSAPQIGKLLRIIIVYSPGSRKFLPMINPEILWQSKRTRLGVIGTKNPYEGCLSVPGIWSKVRRHSIIKVFYQTPNGSLVFRKFRGLTGVIIQHEVDHLNGILFTDRVAEQKGKFFKIEKKPEGKQFFTEIKFQ